MLYIYIYIYEWWVNKVFMLVRVWISGISPFSVTSPFPFFWCCWRAMTFICMRTELVVCALGQEEGTCLLVGLPQGPSDFFNFLPLTCWRNTSMFSPPPPFFLLFLSSSFLVAFLYSHSSFIFLTLSLICIPLHVPSSLSLFHFFSFLYFSPSLSFFLLSLSFWSHLPPPPPPPPPHTHTHIPTCAVCLGLMVGQWLVWLSPHPDIVSTAVPTLDPLLSSRSKTANLPNSSDSLATLLPRKTITITPTGHSPSVKMALSWPWLVHSTSPSQSWTQKVLMSCYD